MKNYELLKTIENIDSKNLFLEYIVDRVQDDNYRGIQCSQHNRLSYDYVKNLMMTIFELAENNRIRIHVGDDSGEKQPEADIYYKIVSSTKNISGKGTINSLKKTPILLELGG